MYLQNRFVLINSPKGDSYMARKKVSRGAASAFQQVQRQARTLLINLRKDIRLKESILSKLQRRGSAPGIVDRSQRRRSIEGNQQWTARPRQLARCSFVAAQAVQGGRRPQRAGPQGQAAVGDFCGDHAMDRFRRRKTKGPRSIRKSLSTPSCEPTATRRRAMKAQRRGERSACAVFISTDPAQRVTAMRSCYTL